MSKTLSKRVCEAEIRDWSSPDSSNWISTETASNGERWYYGVVLFPDGLAVHVQAEPNCKRPFTSLRCLLNGRMYYVYTPYSADSSESLRRAAVAFAKRVRKAASRSRK